MKFVGIDTSYTGTGFTVMDDTLKGKDRFSFKTIKTKPEDFKDDTERIIHIRDEIIKSIPSDVSAVVIEDVFVGHGPSAGASLRLALLAGCVRAGLRDHGIPFTVVPPTMIKKYATGKGNAQKDVIMMTVFKTFDVETKDNNQADSVVMSDLAGNLYRFKNGDVKDLTKQQTATITEIINPKKKKGKAE